MNVDLSAIELFSGTGMLGEGLRAGLGHMGRAYRTVCHVEREAYAASVLAARMEEGSLDAAPIWSDVTTFPAEHFRGKVDCIVAGFPCQDISVAGQRKGLDGARSGLFFEIPKIADACGAWFLFLENVAGIASATSTVVDEAEGELDERAASRVVGELADLGWNAEWIVISASDVGASHGRARWFCLAWRRDVANAEGIRRRIRERYEFTGRAEAESPINQLGNAGLQHVELQQRKDGPEHQRTSDELADSSSIGRQDGSRFAGTETTLDEQSISQFGTSDRCGLVANASGTGSQRHKQSATHEQDGRTDGRTDGRSRNHADQLPNFVMMNFSHQDQTTQDGQQSSPNGQNSPRHLNPLFGAWLMGWPSTWVIAEPHALSALETVSWRSALQSQLSYLLDEPESSVKAAA